MFANILLDVFKFEKSLDYFGGLVFGANPWYSPEVYRSTVQNFKTSISMNITNNYKVEIANLVRFGVELNFVPVLVELHTDMYTTSSLNDNCFMLEGQIQMLRLEVTATKNFARCSNNFHRYFVEAQSLTELANNLLSKNIFLLFDMECFFDDVVGESDQHIDMFSFTFLPIANLERQLLD